jgi:hypothetical protein
MLMQNLDPTNGLYNGTRLLIMKLAHRIVEAKVITGDIRGEVVLIPRIALDCDDKELPFTLRRLQFPQACLRSDNQQESGAVFRFGRYRHDS